ncbi:hypothetical protein IFR05_001612 [Cadophora sp. M221]|nr:hypothetical protein IFR05_001612 [Cadophora sp. M221]
MPSPSVNDSSRLEKNLERGDRGLWHLPSVIVFFAKENDGSVSESLRGGIIYHNHTVAGGTQAPVRGQFLSGELICAITIITRQILSPSPSSSAGGLVLLKEYSARIVSITDTFLRVLDVRYDTSLDQVTYCILSSCLLFVGEDGYSKVDKDLFDVIREVLDAQVKESPAR